MNMRMTVERLMHEILFEKIFLNTLNFRLLVSVITTMCTYTIRVIIDRLLLGVLSVLVLLVIFISIRK